MTGTGGEPIARWCSPAANSLSVMSLPERIPRNSTVRIYLVSSQETEKHCAPAIARKVAWEGDDEKAMSGGSFDSETMETTGIAEVFLPNEAATTAGTDG